VEVRKRWIIIVGFASLLLLVAIGIRQAGPRIHGVVRERTAKFLQARFKSQVEFSDFDVSLFPRVQVTIDGLVMRHNGRTDIPPLFQIRKVSAYANFMSLLRGKPRITLVELDGLQINTPPRHPGGPPLIHGTDQDLAEKYPVLIDEIRADDATLTVLRDQPDKPPREFPIHHLVIHDLSFDRPAAFHAILENAVPTGEINATGQFGPWLADEPADTPAAGNYTFQNANLGTLKGIKGTLSSVGSFSGPLNYLAVEGSTDVPDFALRTTDHPMALHTDFSAIVDGTNGDTYLKSVTAKFQHSTLLVSGEVVDMDRAIKGRTIILDAVSREARVEDFMRLAAKGDAPVMIGSIKLKAKINIPEGNSDLIDRLKINGQFGIDEGQFTNSGVQGKIDTLSRKGRGQPKDADIQSVASEITGHFQLSEAVLSFSSLHFGVTGASINLDGTYNIDSEGLDFHGKLLLVAKPSQTTTGVKSFFLKAIDPFFSGKNAGTVLPIKITGTKENPSFGLDRGGEDSNKNVSPPPKKGES
jgi:hypothetical protein